MAETSLDLAPVKAERAALTLDLERVKTFAITTKAHRVIAAEIGKTIRASIRRLKEKIDAIKDPLNAALKAVRAEESEALSPWEDARKRIDAEQIAWDDAENARIEADRKRIEEMVRKQEEEFRAKEAAKAAAEAKKAEAEEDLDAAVAAQERAAAIVAAPLDLPKIHIPDAPKVKGQATVEYWSADLFDPQAFLAYVVAHPELHYVLEFNKPALNTLAETRKSALNFPGLRAKSEKRISQRSR